MKYSVITIAAVLFLIPFQPGRAQEGTDDPGTLYARAKSAYEEGDFVRAHELFTRYNETFSNGPHSRDVLFFLAECEPVTSRSLDFFTAYLERYPDGPRVPDVRMKIADHHYAVGEYITARDAYLRYLTDHSTGKLRDHATYWLGRSYLALNESALARERFQVFVEEFGESPYVEAAFLGIGDAGYMMGDFRTAGDQYHNMTLKFPEGDYTATAWFRRGVCLERQGDIEGALKLYRRLEDRHPGTTELVEAKKRIRLITTRDEDPEDRFPRNAATEKGAGELERGLAGKASVEVRESTDGTSRTPTIESTGESISGKCHVVQVGAFTNVANATNLRNKLENKGYVVEIIPRDIGGRRLFSVWVGSCLTEEKAMRLGLGLQNEEGLNFRIVERR